MDNKKIDDGIRYLVQVTDVKSGKKSGSLSQNSPFIFSNVMYVFIINMALPLH